MVNRSPDEIVHPYEGNIPGGVIRGVEIKLDFLKKSLVANELFECRLSGIADESLVAFESNLISCCIEEARFSCKFSGIDAKDSLFSNVDFTGDFSDNLINDCTFQRSVFSGALFRNTVFVECHFEEVEFTNCDFSQCTFKGNKFDSCYFFSCTTSNKLLEHCNLLACKFENMRILETTVLQNFGLQISGMHSVSIIRPETGDLLKASDLVPNNKLERISYLAFLEGDLNNSKELAEAVSLNFSNLLEVNIFHILSGLKCLTVFLEDLYKANRLLLFFLVKLFIAVHGALEQASRKNYPATAVTTLELCVGKLRKYYENLLLAADGLVSEGASSLVLGGVLVDNSAQSALENIVKSCGLNVYLKNFKRLNSPSLGTIASSNPTEMLLMMAALLAARFKLEVVNYEQDSQKMLLTLGATQASDSNSLSYGLLLALNFPNVVGIKLSMALDLSLIQGIRNYILGLVRAPKSSKLLSSYGRSKNHSDSVGPRKVLFLGANSARKNLFINIEREVRKIKDGLRSGIKKGMFELIQEWDVSEDTFLEVVAEQKPMLIHFSGHGTRKGILVSDGHGGLKTVSGDALSSLMHLLRSDLECVVLNACFSETQANIIRSDIPFVIGVQDDISDDLATAFSTGFYKAIGAGREIPFAFQLGVAAMRLCSQIAKEPVFLAKNTSLARRKRNKDPNPA